MKKDIIKKIFTKRNILVLVNGIFFILICVCCSLYIEKGYNWIHGNQQMDILIAVFKFSLIQCVFTFLSLIVYYLSIMAGALNKKYKEEVDDNASDKK